MINTNEIMNIFLSKKLFVSLILLAFLVVGLFGLFHFAMNMNNGGDALGCPFMNVTALCTMNPLVHITAWQNMFAASFSKEIFSLLIFIFLMALLASILLPMRRSSDVFCQHTHYLWHPINQILTVRNPLQEAFSNGILNSKLYNFRGAYL